jgi:DNA-binding LytR/AlgR family response regulator
MAAEMSTGLLSMLTTYNSKPPISMLVTHLEAVYHKKATGLTTFTCADGDAIKAIINECIATNEAQTFKATSIGVDEAGLAIATFYITWSFKAKL